MKIPILVAVLLLAGCSGGGGAASAPSADPRAAAIQKTLDMQATAWQNVYSGETCLTGIGVAGMPAMDSAVAQRYRALGAHVSAYRKAYGMQCWTISWPTSDDVEKRVGGGMQVRLAHYIVDKVGEEQAGAMGMRWTPFRAHPLMTPTGTRFVAAHLARKPLNIADGQAVLRKDPDGNWVAQM